MTPSSGSDRAVASVLGVPIDVVDWPTAVQRIGAWARTDQSRYVCICNAHSVVTATRDAGFYEAVTHADMATADGAPVAWMIRRLTGLRQPRINGPDLMLELCISAAELQMPIGLLGSTPQTLEALRAQLAKRWPKLQIAFEESPPFRPLAPEEEAALMQRIAASGARILFVSLGCPKQELWMARQRSKVRTVMVGVGAAFDFHAGTVPRAPEWMRTHGLEWLHRLYSEPRRLWRRYLVTNTLFIVGAVRQWAQHLRRPAG